MNSEFETRLHAAGIIAVVVLDDADSAVPLAQALLQGGVTAMELTLRTPAALESLRRVRDDVPDMFVGAGTVLSPEQVGAVAEAGAFFGVAPGMNPRVVAEARRRGLPFAPGVLTPSDIECALEAECRLMKFFPSEPMGGLAYLKCMAAPYAHLKLRFIPLGGLDLGNVGRYLADPLVPAIGGSWLAPRELIKERNWGKITDNARQAADVVRCHRQGVRA